MSKEHVHDELHRFVFDLNHYTVLQPDDEQDEVWRKILRDVHDYENRKNNPWYSEDAPAHNYAIEQSNRPDIIYECDDYIMGIECFEFDASKKTRKGSKQKQKEDEVDRAIEEEYLRSTVPEGSFLSIERPVDVELSAKNYLESFILNYTDHARAIAKYRQNLTEKAPGKKVLLAFFIEDATAIGNYAVVDGKTEALDPLKIPFVLKVLAATQGLDYVIIKTTDSYVPSLKIQKISIPLMTKLLRDCYGPYDKYVSYQYKRESHTWR